jgi:hypothetical protein
VPQPPVSGASVAELVVVLTVMSCLTFHAMSQ